MNPVSTIFDFGHKFFDFPGNYFALTADQRPAYFMKIGDMRGSLAISALKGELKLEEEDRDSKLLDLVGSSLVYVKKVFPGDSIPNELLDGSASWSVEDRHRQLARSRLVMMLASWATGEEADLSRPDQVLALAEKPETKNHVQRAFTRLALELGMPPEDKAKIIDGTESLSRELSYIEALRDKFTSVIGILPQLEDYASAFRRHMDLAQNVQRVKVLIRPPLKDVKGLFDSVDGNTGDILALFRQFDGQVAFIRKIRDDLHVRSMLWDGLLRDWQTPPTGRVEEVEALVRQTYQFVATNFPQGVVWKRKNIAQPGQSAIASHV